MKTVRFNGSSVIQIDNLELLGEDVPKRRKCFTCATFGHSRSGYTTEVCTDRRLMGDSATSGQYINYHVVIANELRRLGIDPPADWCAQSDQESANGEEPELGLVSQ